jgi:hypothetical protein
MVSFFLALPAKLRTRSSSLQSLLHAVPVSIYLTILFTVVRPDYGGKAINLPASAHASPPNIPDFPLFSQLPQTQSGSFVFLSVQQHSKSHSRAANRDYGATSGEGHGTRVVLWLASSEFI